MLDIIARLIISAGLMVGAAHLPALSPAGDGGTAASGALRDGRPCMPRPGAGERPGPRACAA